MHICLYCMAAAASGAGGAGGVEEEEEYAVDPSFARAVAPASFLKRAGLTRAGQERIRVEEIPCDLMRSGPGAAAVARECGLSRLRFSRKEYPGSCRIKCAHDHCFFKGPPIFAVQEMLGGKWIRLYPKAFCSPGCRNTWLLRNGPPGTRELQIQQSVDLDVDLGIWPAISQDTPFAPPVGTLVVEGGDTSLDEFRHRAWGGRARDVNVPGRCASLEGYHYFFTGQHMTLHVQTQAVLAKEETTEDIKKERKETGIAWDDEEDVLLDQTDRREELIELVEKLRKKDAPGARDEPEEEEIQEAIHGVFKESIAHSMKMRDVLSALEANGNDDTKLSAQDRERLERSRDRRSGEKRREEARLDRPVHDTRGGNTAQPRWSVRQAQREEAESAHGVEADKLARKEMLHNGTAIGAGLRSVSDGDYLKRMLQKQMELG